MSYKVLISLQQLDVMYCCLTEAKILFINLSTQHHSTQLALKISVFFCDFEVTWNVTIFNCGVLKKTNTFSTLKTNPFI